MKCGTRREDADRIREEMAEASKKDGIANRWSTTVPSLLKERKVKRKI